MLASILADGGRPARRFGWVAAGHRLGPDRVFDQDLAEMDAVAVLPTKGAIVPEWLLVVPKIEALSLAEVGSLARRAVLDCVKEVEEHVSQAAGDAVIFEHGAGRRGSASGCGVDQAHLHVVGLDRHFVESVLVMPSAELRWRSVDTTDPWEGLPPGSDYLMMMHGETAWRALTSTPTSQFMRRRIAHFVGTPGEWDYRRYPHADNAERTKALFRFNGNA